MSAGNMQVKDVLRKQPVSVRKAEANRRNASKSTGPRTATGKANSRKNAIKHGLFVRAIDEAFFDEDPKEFLNFYHRLWNEKQPVGPCEESEIEYIAVCWLRLARLFRYENAEIASGRQSVVRNSELGDYGPYIDAPDRAKLMSLLDSAKSQAETSGKISPDLLETIFREDVIIRMSWPGYEAWAEALAQKKTNEIARMIAEEKNMPISEAKILLARNQKEQPQFTRFVAREIVDRFMSERAQLWYRMSSERMRTDCQLQTIPHDDAVNKIVRYGNAIERHMSRAYVRLDRLQAGRKGEFVPPVVDVHLTR